MKMHIDLEWLSGKSEAEQRALLDDSGATHGWAGGPRYATEQELEAIRNGKPYAMNAYDLERLGALETGLGCNGNMHTDPFIVKMIVKGYITENPKRLQEIANNNRQIARLQTQYGPGRYSIGVGLSNRQWVLTDAGRRFASQFTQD